MVFPFYFCYIWSFSFCVRCPIFPHSTSDTQNDATHCMNSDEFVESWKLSTWKCHSSQQMSLCVEWEATNSRKLNHNRVEKLSTKSTCCSFQCIQCQYTWHSKIPKERFPKKKNEDWISYKKVKSVDDGDTEIVKWEVFIKILVGRSDTMRIVTFFTYWLFLFYFFHCIELVHVKNSGKPIENGRH